MNVIIVDDEKPAREELRWLIEQAGGLQVVAEASSGEDTLQILRTQSVDLVFLDIDMPGIGGMRLAELLDDMDLAPSVIFVTAYEHHALEAFGVNAQDYLLKPVRLERLEKALERVRQRRLAPEVVRPARPLTRISVDEKGVYKVIPVADVLFFESEDGVVVIQTKTKRYLTDFSLKFLEQNLNPDDFFRCHRSYIVRIDAIESIAPWGAGTYKLILDRDAEIDVPLARARAQELKTLIPWSANQIDIE